MNDQQTVTSARGGLGAVCRCSLRPPRTDGTYDPISRRLPLARAGEAQTFAEHHAGGKVILTGRAS